jgi:hypothetical protein
MDPLDVVENNRGQKPKLADIPAPEAELTPATENIIKIEENVNVEPQSRIEAEGVLDQVIKLPSGFVKMEPEYLEQLPNFYNYVYLDGRIYLLNLFSSNFKSGDSILSLEHLVRVFKSYVDYVGSRAKVLIYGQRKTKIFLRSNFIEKPDTMLGLDFFNESEAMLGRSETVNTLIDLFNNYALIVTPNHVDRYVKSANYRAFVDSYNARFFRWETFRRFGLRMIDHVSLFLALERLLRGPNKIYDRLAFTRRRNNEYLSIEGNAVILDFFRVNKMTHRKMNLFGFDQVSNALRLTILGENVVTRRLQEDLQITSTRIDGLSAIISKLGRSDPVPAFKNIFSSLFVKSMVSIHIDHHYDFDPITYVACALIHLLYPYGMIHPDTRLDVFNYLRKFSTMPGNEPQYFNDYRYMIQRKGLHAKLFHDDFRRVINKRVATPFDEMIFAPTTEEEPFEYLMTRAGQELDVANTLFARQHSHYEFQIGTQFDDLVYQQHLERALIFMAKRIWIGRGAERGKIKEKAAHDLLMALSKRLPYNWNDLIYTVTQSSQAIAANYFADPFPGREDLRFWERNPARITNFVIPGPDDDLQLLGLVDTVHDGTIRDDDIMHITSVDVNSLVAMHLMLDDKNKIIGDISLDVSLQALAVSVDLINAAVELDLLNGLNPDRWLTKSEKYDLLVSLHEHAFLKKFCLDHPRECYNIIANLPRAGFSTFYSATLQQFPIYDTIELFPTVDLLYYETKTVTVVGMNEDGMVDNIEEGSPAFFTNALILENYDEKDDSALFSYRNSIAGPVHNLNVQIINWAELRTARLQYDPVFLNKGQPYVIKDVPYSIAMSKSDNIANFPDSEFSISNDAITFNDPIIKLNFIERYNNMHRKLLAEVSRRNTSPIISLDTLRKIVIGKPTHRQTEEVYALNRRLQKPEFSDFFRLRRLP